MFSPSPSPFPFLLLLPPSQQLAFLSLSTSTHIKGFASPATPTTIKSLSLSVATPTTIKKPIVFFYRPTPTTTKGYPFLYAYSIFSI